MKEHIMSTRQVGILVFFIMLSTKILYLPSLFFKDVGTNALLAMTLALLLDFLLLIFVYKFSKNNPGISLYDFIKKHTFNWIAKIVYLFIFAFLAIKLILVLNASFVYVRDSFFTQMKNYLFLVVVLFVCNFMTVCPSRAMARTVEFFYPATFLGIILTLYLGLTSNIFQLPNTNWYADFSNIFSSNFKYLAFIGDALVIALLNDNIKYDKNYRKNIFKYGFLAIISCFLLYFVYFGLVSFMAPSHISAAQDITQFTDFNDDIGRLDFFSSVIYLIVSLLQCGIYFRYCIKTLVKIFPEKYQNWEQVIFNIILVVALYTIFDSNEKTIFIATNYINYLTLSVAYILPVFLSFFSHSNYKKRVNKKQKKPNGDAYEKVN